MNRSWLVQRLEQPHGTTPFDFGGGLPNGGLSREAMDVLNTAFSFDYMGAAEFEYGAVPKALQTIADNRRRLVADSFEINLAHVPLSWRAPKDTPDPHPGEVATIYLLCQKKHRHQIVTRILGWATERHNSNLKEPTRLAEKLRPHGQSYTDRLGGWLELDNGFFFFTDRVMWERVASMFGVAAVAAP